MTQFLPPNLLILFSAREMPNYLPPVDKLTHEKKRQPYTGIAEYLQHFEVSGSFFFVGLIIKKIRLFHIVIF
jgi:hypothetical protein